MHYDSQIESSLDKLTEVFTSTLPFESMSTPDTKSKIQDINPQKRSKKESGKKSAKKIKSKTNRAQSPKFQQLPAGEVQQKSHEILYTITDLAQDHSPTKERNGGEAKTKSRAASLCSEESSVSGVLSTEAAEGGISSEKPGHVPIEKLNEASNADTTTVEIPNFKLPRNFINKEVQEDPSISSLFNESNLEGKHIWYFTTPSTLEISSLENVSSSTIISEEPVIKKNGDEYIFIKDLSETQNYKIIVPVATKNGYKVVSRPVSRILSLQQILEETKVKKCKTGTGSSIITASRSEMKREQPNGLKMRFHPLGFFNEPPEVIGDDSSEQSSNEEAENGRKSINLPPPNPTPKNHKKTLLAPKQSHKTIQKVKHSNDTSRQKLPEEKSHSHKRKHE